MESKSVSGRPDLNWRPSLWERDVLPTELLPLFTIGLLSVFEGLTSESKGVLVPPAFTLDHFTLKQMNIKVNE